MLLYLRSIALRLQTTILYNAPLGTSIDGNNTADYYDMSMLLLSDRYEMTRGIRRMV